MTQFKLRPAKGDVLLKFGLTSSLVGVMALSSLGFAQTAVIEGDQEAQKPERIKVTGSHIKRTDAEGVSSIIVLDREALDRSGVSTVSEVLQNLTVVSNGSYSSPAVNDVRGNVTRVNLRGLGSANTLVLLDGRRLPDEGGEGTVDLSTIPMAAVERIEILKDSASAIYGSDAIGGVVNVITKKDFNGSAFYARASQPDGLKGNQQTTFSYLTGVAKDGFRMMTSLSYRHVEPTFYRDREWTEEGLSFYAFPGNYSLQTPGSQITAHPNCELSANKPIQAVQGGNDLCSYNYGATSAFSPETTELSFLNNMEYDVSENVSFFTNLRALKNTNLWNMAPNAGFFTIPQAVVNASPDKLGLAGQLNELGLTEAPSDLKVYYRGVPWGVRQWEETKTLFGGALGLRGLIGTSWDWSASVSHSESKKDSVNPQGFMLKDELVAGIESGAFNPFETNLSQSSIDVVNSASYQPFVITETDLQSYNFDVSGELFEMPGGYAGLALGVQRTEQGYSKLIDRQSELDNVFGVTNDQGDTGDRSVNAVYAEIALPVMSNLEFQVAARYDDYSDFGSSTNPKFGFKYLPVDRFLLRGNVATGFKAPTLKEIHRGKTITLADLEDSPVCGLNNCTDLTTEVEIETEGNKQLQEETSLAYNFGFVTEPINGLALSADYWYVKIEDIITEMDPQEVLDAIARGQSFDGVEIARLANSTDGRLERIKIPVLNLGESEDSGIDTAVSYNFAVGANRFRLDSEYSRKFYSKSVPFPGVSQKDFLGDRGQPRWRSVTSAIWGLSGHSVMLRNNIIGTQESQNDPDLRISQFSTYDLQYAWAHPWDGTVAVGALNVLDTDFPEDPTVRAGDDTRVRELFSPDGRTFYVNVNQVF